jgi:hypothetical protein
MTMETLDTILEEIADRSGICSHHIEGEQTECRSCFIRSLRQRLIKAVKFEIAFREYLKKAEQRY